jgi:hypothetical protein
MAFQQQHKRPQPARQVSYATSGEHIEATASLTLQRASTRNTLDTSEEWVLFSPTAPSVTQTHTTSTDRTPRTAGLSRLSDFGSLDTAARSDQVTDDVDDNGTEQATDADEEAELDSLDDGLHAFHEPSDYGSPRQMLHRSGETVLPTHDGLGTFGGASDAIQHQLWRFEQEAQRRKHKRRTSSVQRTLEALEEAEEVSEETERFRRVENWRLEQSRALLEEIERETRRMRRLSRANSYRSQRTESVSNFQTKSETNFSSGIGTPTIEEVPEPQAAPPPSVHEENESFWQRITRRVIRDLIGIDEEILSVILGEALPEEARESPASSVHDITKDKALETVDGVPLEGETWQHRLLERVARELGILVHQLSEHPGAFSTYLKAAETPSYAGITHPASAASSIPRRASSSNITTASPSAALFAPTLPQQSQSDPSLWGIEEEPQPEEMLAGQSGSMDTAMLQQEREYWERELDIKMVFQFLKNKFSSRPSSPEPADSNVPYVGSYSSPSRRPSAYSAASGQRAALIRQHHPLASKLEQNRKKDLSHRHHAHHHAVVPQNAVRSRLGVRTRSDSCASQSTKRSRKSGSSRNFWDLGGSVGSGPAGLGAWGEVGI